MLIIEHFTLNKILSWRSSANLIINCAAAITALSLISCDLDSINSAKKTSELDSAAARTTSGGVNSVSDPQFFSNRVGGTIGSPVSSLVRISPVTNVEVMANIPEALNGSIQWATISTTDKWHRTAESTIEGAFGGGIGEQSLSGDFQRNVERILDYSEETVNGVIYQIFPGPFVKLVQADMRPEALSALSNPGTFASTFGSAIATEVQLGGFFAGRYRWKKKVGYSISVKEMEYGMFLKIKDILSVTGSAALDYREKDSLYKLQSKIDVDFQMTSTMPSGALPLTSLDGNNLITASNKVGQYMENAWARQPNYYFSVLSVKYSPLSSTDFIWRNVSATNLTKLQQVKYFDPNSFLLDSVGVTRDIQNFTIGLEYQRGASFISNVNLYYNAGGSWVSLGAESFYAPSSNRYTAQINIKDKIPSSLYKKLGSMKFMVVPMSYSENKWLAGSAAMFNMSDNRGSTISFGEGLFPNDYIKSPNGSHKLIMQDDGNLCDYGGGGSRGRTPFGTMCNMKQGQGLQYLVFESDGSVKTKRMSDNAVTWSTPAGGAYLLIQDDGNVVLYDSYQRPIWAEWGLPTLGF